MVGGQFFGWWLVWDLILLVLWVLLLLWTLSAYNLTSRADWQNHREWETVYERLRVQDEKIELQGKINEMRREREIAAAAKSKSEEIMGDLRVSEIEHDERITGLEMKIEALEREGKA